jgi:hypothetical protein
MNGKSQKDLEPLQATENPCAVRHSAWCGLTRCIADPAATRDGYRPVAAGEHCSALIPLNLGGAYWLPARDGAGRTEACAPYLRVEVGDVLPSMAADDAGQVLDVLSALAAAARAGEGVPR